MTTFQVANVYRAFEDLEMSLDKAWNDAHLDKAVCIGANRALFILRKYYNKLDNCEVYLIATSESPVLHAYGYLFLCSLHSPHSYKNILLVQEESWLAGRLEAYTHD